MRSDGGRRTSLVGADAQPVREGLGGGEGPAGPARALWVESEWRSGGSGGSALKQHRGRRRRRAKKNKTSKRRGREQEESKRDSKKKTTKKKKCDWHRGGTRMQTDARTKLASTCQLSRRSATKHHQGVRHLVSDGADGCTGRAPLLPGVEGGRRRVGGLHTARWLEQVGRLGRCPLEVPGRVWRLREGNCRREVAGRASTCSRAEWAAVGSGSLESAATSRPREAEACSTVRPSKFGFGPALRGCERGKRAGTSPVNAVVREMVMERQVHFQSSD